MSPSTTEARSPSSDAIQTPAFTGASSVLTSSRLNCRSEYPLKNSRSSSLAAESARGPPLSQCHVA